MTTSEDLNDAIWARESTRECLPDCRPAEGIHRVECPNARVGETVRNASVVTRRTVFVSDDVTVIRSSTLRALLRVAGDQATLADALGVSRSTISRALAEAGEMPSDRQARIETVRALLGPEQTAGKNDATPRAALAPEDNDPDDPPSGALPAEPPMPVDSLLDDEDLEVMREDRDPHGM